MNTRLSYSDSNQATAEHIADQVLFLAKARNVGPKSLLIQVTHSVLDRPWLDDGMRRELIDAVAVALDMEVGHTPDDKCECESPGFFHSGVPGILAHMEDGRLAEGAGVERCDQCERFPTDEAALETLRNRGLV